MEDFTREELQGIERKALNMSYESLNEFWQRAYRNLADACDRLDAMMARTIDYDEILLETIKDKEHKKKEAESGITIKIVKDFCKTDD